MAVNSEDARAGYSYVKAAKSLTKECDSMKKFEYKVITIPTNIPLGARGYEKAASEFEARLNKLGADGWELVQRMDSFFFFKREIAAL